MGKRITDTDRMDAIIGGLVFWRTKYNSGYGAHWSAKHGVEESSTHFSQCPREAIDGAITNTPINHCACCSASRRGKKR